MERKFNCKNEELPIVAGYVSSNLNRDLDNFTRYRPHSLKRMPIILPAVLQVCRTGQRDSKL